MTTITREQQKQILIDTANHVISRDNTSPYSENLRELARIALARLPPSLFFTQQRKRLLTLIWVRFTLPVYQNQWVMRLFRYTPPRQ
ncbi:hypothetical protein YF48_004663, partial [Salmonella enterica subsp. enterica serovar Singapore]|nr:hypothetical protein [Salmonella enterica subsp. enterica serovar Singapore]